MFKLTQINIDGTGTVRGNRLQKHQFKADSKMKRGKFDKIIFENNLICMLKR